MEGLRSAFRLVEQGRPVASFRVAGRGGRRRPIDGAALARRRRDFRRGRSRRGRGRGEGWEGVVFLGIAALVLLVFLMLLLSGGDEWLFRRVGGARAASGG